MDNKKKLMVNTAVMDMTGTREESLAAYSEIKINAATVIVSEEVRPLLSRYGVKINAAAVVGVPNGCKVSVVNGNSELTAASAAKEATALIVNGALYVSADAEEAIASYEKIFVNGHIYAPESIQGLAGKIQLNGSATYYPDSYRLIRGNLNIDRMFLLRAKEGEQYFITGNLLITDDSLKTDELLRKNLRFRAKTAYLSGAYEDAAALIDEATAVELIPEGYKVCVSSLHLDESAFHRYGKSICVLGDFIADRGARAHLDSLTDLFVYGCAKIPEADKDAYLQKLRRFGSLSIYKGALIGDEGSLAVNGELLAEYEDGVTIEDCGAVIVDPELDAGILREKVHMISDCGAVKCAPDQLGVLRKRAKECGYVGILAEEDAEEHADDSDDTVVINAATYAL